MQKSIGKHFFLLIHVLVSELYAVQHFQSTMYSYLAQRALDADLPILFHFG